LAWLAVSGEDAPDLLASAPILPRQVIAAKIEAVLIAIAIVFLPFVAGLLLLSAGVAIIVALGIAAASISAAKIQLWFRSQAKRSHFRRRQISSRIATFAEAFSSITWAGAAGLATAETWLAVIPVVLAFGILGLARALAPR
jgi:ABC-2 type transport system permease protein